MDKGILFASFKIERILIYGAGKKTSDIEGRNCLGEWSTRQNVEG